jgi:hypothetical protein
MDAKRGDGLNAPAPLCLEFTPSAMSRPFSPIGEKLTRPEFISGMVDHEAFAPLSHQYRWKSRDYILSRARVHDINLVAIECETNHPTIRSRQDGSEQTFKRGDSPSDEPAVQAPGQSRPTYPAESILENGYGIPCTGYEF